MERAEPATLVRSAGEQGLEEEIASARLALRRILAILDRSRIGGLEAADQVADTGGTPDQTPSLTPGEYARLASLALQAVRTVARLLRDERAISGNAARDIPAVIAQALDGLGAEWGRDL